MHHCPNCPQVVQAVADRASERGWQAAAITTDMPTDSTSRWADGRLLVAALCAHAGRGACLGKEHSQQLHAAWPAMCQCMLLWAWTHAGTAPLPLNPFVCCRKGSTIPPYIHMSVKDWNVLKPAQVGCQPGAAECSVMEPTDHLLRQLQLQQLFTALHSVGCTSCP
jgi:hypothetical protein